MLLCLVYYDVALADENPDDVVEELSDAYIRENPEVDTSGEYALTRIDYSAYPFLKPEANLISLNGSEMINFITAIAQSEDRPVNIVHIGDSHIQADMATGRTRQLLQSRFGSFGRGLVVPLKLAGTNEPRDYAIKSDSRFVSDKLLSYPWSGKMGFTGVSLMPMTSEFKITLSAQEPFERFVVYYSGNALSVSSIEYDGSPLVYVADDSRGALEVGLPFPCEQITVSFSTLGQVSIYGMSLISDMIGVAYHSIGINGATYSSYNRVDDLGEEVAMLSPDLIIVSLGTNEAFGRINEDVFYRQVDDLVSELRKNNPAADILLVTPAECQRRIRRGRRRSSYIVNDNIAKVRQVIVDYGRRNNVPVYDWYEAAGGAGSSAKWIEARLLNRDRVHCTFAGYEVAGQMLYDALMKLSMPDDIQSLTEQQ